MKRQQKRPTNKRPLKPILKPVHKIPIRQEPHPYPYVKTPDVYLLTEENDEKHKPFALPEDIVERFILDTPFAKGFLEEFLSDAVEHEVRNVVLNFTTRQGPANKPKTSSSVPTSSMPVSSNDGNMSKKDKQKEHICQAITDDILNEEVQIQIRQLLWATLDENAILFDEETYQKIVNNERGHVMNPELIKDLKQHVMRVGQSLRNKQRTHQDNLDHSKFKGVPTNTYLFQFHKLWRELITTDNYAERYMKMKFCNEAVWHYFYKELISEIQASMLQLDKEEAQKYTLKYYDELSND